jgi:nicotinate-nucleotide adenylyltransferase
MGLTPPVGLLGGSFDPIHFGHLQLARDAAVQLGLAQVRFVPAALPWQKGAITEARHRVEMVRLAIAGLPDFAIDTIEIERGGASYTIDTVRELRQLLGPQVPLALVMGGDQLRNLDTWRDWRRLTEFAHLAIARRNDRSLELNPASQAFVEAHAGTPDAIRQAAAGRIVQFAMTPSAASATEARALLRLAVSPERDARLAALVPGPVLDYIRHNALYRET